MDQSKLFWELLDELHKKINEVKYITLKLEVLKQNMIKNHIKTMNKVDIEFFKIINNGMKEEE